MSFTETEAVGTTEVESPVEATTDAGIEASPEDVVEETTEAPQTFTIKVDGSEEEVTLDELRNGYQRQSDYTRKTQEIAAERQRVQQYDALAYALQTNPQDTLSQLAQELGVDFADTPEVDPEEKRWQNVERFIASQTQREQQAQANASAQVQIDHELRALQADVGEFDSESLIRYAVEHSIPVLAEAYKAQQYDATKAQAKQAATAAKRQDAVVEGGTSRNAKAVTPGGSERMSIREAYRAAVAKVGT